MAFRIQTRASSADSSQEQIEHDSSMEMMHSPDPPPVVSSALRRRLEFASPGLYEENNNKVPHKTRNIINNNNYGDNDSNCKKVPASVSPPYRKVRNLRLFDTPATPKTILQKSSANHLSSVLNTVAKHHNVSSHPPVPASPIIHNSILNAHTRNENLKPAGRDVLPLHNRALNNAMQQQVANVNPFTPDSLLAHNKKRCRIALGQPDNHNHSLSSYFATHERNATPELMGNDDDWEIHSAPKRLALQDTNISRYQKEFVEISLIGIGEFGLVYQCLNRLDGCIYAIKKSIRPVAGSSFEKRALNEVWAHAVLGKHDNVVRYYSAWAEDNHMLIQNEFCNGGSLQALIQRRSLNESELKLLLLHVAEGLRYIHSNDLVHMDVKAGNIFITKEIPHKIVVAAAAATTTTTTSVQQDHNTSSDDGMEGIYEELKNEEYIITFKIGDLGHVTSIQDPNVEEGDCRYLPDEILQEDYSRLDKADIFSLGITLYEAAGGGPLPKNGPEWHELRSENIPKIQTLSKEFNELIQLMTHPDPDKRPSSTSIFNHPVLSAMESKTKAQLTQELVIEKQKNEILLKKLCEAKKLIKAYEMKEKGRRYSQSPMGKVEPRYLRSCTRKKQRVNGKVDSLHDRKKNVVNC